MIPRTAATRTVASSFTVEAVPQSRNVSFRFANRQIGPAGHYDRSVLKVVSAKETAPCISNDVLAPIRCKSCAVANAEPPSRVADGGIPFDPLILIKLVFVDVKAIGRIGKARRSADARCCRLSVLS